MTERQYLRSEPGSDPDQPTGEAWRKELHSHLARYRVRRGRRIEGAYSMRFPFPVVDAVAEEKPPECPPLEEPATSLTAVANEISTSESEVLLVEAPPLAGIEVTSQPEEQIVEEAPASPEPALSPVETRAAPEPELTPAPAPRPRPKRKVIAFPKPADPTQVIHRLADPVLPEEPRILDVPEELEPYPTTPFLDGLHFGPTPQSAPPQHVDHVDLPFHAAGIGRRLGTGVIDGVVVASAAGLLGVVAHRIVPKALITKPLLLAATAILVILWAAYQYILQVYAGATVGMVLTKTRLRTFKGAFPKWEQRRNRVLAFYLSAGSLAMGLLWALVDVDKLCWHDRISRTYLSSHE